MSQHLSGGGPTASVGEGGGRASNPVVVSSSPAVGYPEAFYAHTHKTPERSNRQKKIPTPATEPAAPEDDLTNTTNSNTNGRRPAGREVGRLRPQQLNLFHNKNSSSTTNNNNGKGNVGNGYSHIQQQSRRQQQPKSPPAAHARTQQQQQDNISVAECQSQASAASTAYASQATLAAAIPSSHVSIITQAYGNSVDIYQDILKISPDTSDREIRIAYFRRGRQVLAEKPDLNNNKNKVNTVSQLAKMKFQAVSMTYEILSNPAWKESYDLYGLYGPDAFQEPEGTSVLLAEDASLADPRAAKNKSTSTTSASDRVQPSPATMLYNLRSAAMTISNSTSDEASSPEGSPTASSLRPQSTKRPVVSATPPTMPSSDTNRVSSNSDNVSCVSQSTAGTNTSNGVLRKTGSFLEKLNKQKAHLRERARMEETQQHQQRNSTGNNPQTTNHFPPAQPAATVRWNEEVEELIFRQDPDEISFKARTTNTSAPILEDEEEDPHHHEEPYSQSPESSGQQQHQQTKGGTEANARMQNNQGPVDNAYRHHAGGASVRSSRANDSKRRVVLDTAELGTHLEKLDKVADSIADIFDELEASFDGLLGGFGSTPRQTAAARSGKSLSLPVAAPVTSSLPAVPPLLPPPSHHHHHHVEHQPAQSLSQSEKNIPVDAPHGEVSRMMDSQAALLSQRKSQLEETSYPTPPISLQQQKEEQLPAPPVPTLAQQEEARRVEEQAMALLREVTAAPPSDVVVKTKKYKHQSHQSALCDAALLAGQEANQRLLEARSTYPISDMAAGGDNTTVATSVVSLLDPQQQPSNAPLKPAASTEIRGAKASRKRLKNVQRRRQQQQRTKEQQQSALLDKEQENFFDYLDPMNVLNTPLAAKRDNTSPASAKDRTNQWNEMAKSSFVDSHGNKKQNKKTEDLYFESLYQNFFALPKERSPNEMTVRTRPVRSSCSVSTLSHSVATIQDSSKLEFDPWDLANSAWSKMGDKADEGEKRSRHHSNVMARVDEMLAQRSVVSAVDTTFDSSLPEDLDTTYDSGTAMDTTFDSTIADTAFSSAIDLPRKSEMSEALNCARTPGEAFLNTVFDVPLEAPLEYWCGEMKDCASSTKPTPKQKRLADQTNHLKQLKPVTAAKEKISSVESPKSAILEEEEDGPPTDESITLMDPPTHDSRLFAPDASRCDDDSTLNTVNTNHVEYNSDSRSEYYNESSNLSSTCPSQSLCNEDQGQATNNKERSAKDAGPEHPGMASPRQPISVARDPSVDSSCHNLDDNKNASRDNPLQVAKDPSIESPRQFINFAKDPATTSESQFVHVAASDHSSALGDTDTASVTTPVPSEGEEREGVSPSPVGLQSYTPEIGSHSNPDHPTRFESDSASAMGADMIPSPSSLTGRRVEFADVAPSKHEFQIEVQDEGLESSATSVSSAVSSEKANSSSFLTHMLTYLQNATAENPSLACISANFSSGLESWQASNDACMDAIVIDDEDMDGMLDILQNEMLRPTPGFMPKSE